MTKPVIITEQIMFPLLCTSSLDGVVVLEDEQLNQLEMHVLNKFKYEFGDDDIELIPNDDLYLDFTMKATSNDGDSRSDDMFEAYEFLKETCKELGLVLNA